MLLPIFGCGKIIGIDQRPGALVFRNIGYRDCVPHRAIDTNLEQVQIARRIGANRGIGEDHDRRLQTLRAVNCHDPDLVVRRARLAL